MRKKVTWIILWFTLILILTLFWFFLYKEMDDYTNIIRLNRWVKIPEEANYKEIYSKNSGSSFHGDGLRYHVYSYENEEPIAWMVDWSGNIKLNPAVYYDSYVWGIYDSLQEMYSSEENSDKLNNLNFWHKWQDDNSEIIMIQDKEAKKIYIIESFL